MLCFARSRFLVFAWPLLFTGMLSVTTAQADEASTAALLKQIGVKRGLVTLVGTRMGETARELARSSKLTLFVQSPDAADVAAVRKALAADGLLGTRIFVEQGDYSRIHLADNLADAIVVRISPLRGKGVPQKELLRVVQPRGKVISGGTVTVKPVPAGEGEWSHPYHGPDNNPQSQDKIARAPFLTKFLATPYYGPMPEVTVTSGGRMFKAFGHISFKKREWAMLGQLVAVNSYNGTQLWQRDLQPGWMIHRNGMIATPDTLFLAGDESCQLIDAATGKVRDEIRISPKQGGPSWKWITMSDGVLYALVGEQEMLAEVLRGTRKKSGWPWSGLGKEYALKSYPWGFGHTLLAIDPQTKKVLWSRSEKEQLDSRATAMKNGRIYTYCHQKFLACIDVNTGEDIWRTTSPELLEAIGDHHFAQNPRRGYSSQVYMKVGEKALYFAGPQRKQLVAASTEDGRLLWNMEDGNYQLIIRDDALYAMGRESMSKKIDLVSGKILSELDCMRGNCTRATGTADSIFTRGYRHGGTMRLNVYDDHPYRLPAMRPACQDGVIASNGQLFWGPWMCDCNHSLVGIISLTPAPVAFDYEQSATNESRLETSATDVEKVAAVEVTANDWPTYRKNNRRTANTDVSVPTEISRLWQFAPPKSIRPTAPVTAGGLAFVAGSDGIVRAFHTEDGKPAWTAFTGGPVRYPPAVWNNQLYVGSGDGWIYAFEAATGRQLWRFRAAPVERKIPVYGSLVSTWPVNSGVLIEDGTVYAAAGIVSHDGTHVYALDAVTGRIKWQNNTSGHLMEGDEVAGVSVQGHMLLNEGKLYMAGGNVVSPGIYDVGDGKCLNVLDDEWQKGPRGSEPFLADGKVRVVDRMLYSPRAYIPSRYYAKYLVEASAGDVLIQGTESAMMRVELTGGEDGKPKLIWKDSRFVETSAVVLAKNAVVVVGSLQGETAEAAPKPVLLALDIETGKTLWSEPLPVPAENWGLAINRDGQLIVTLTDGRVFCYGN